jgi:chromosome segregation ATPase
MNINWDTVITILALFVAALSWVAKLRWSQEFKSAKEAQIETLMNEVRSLESSKGDIIKAKDAQIETLKNELRSLEGAKEQTIEAKDAQIAALQSELQTYRDLTPMKLREYYISFKEQFEEITNLLQRQLTDAKAQIEMLNQHIKELRLEGRAKAEEAEQVTIEKARVEERALALERQIENLKNIYQSKDTLHIKFPAIDLKAMDAVIRGAVQAMQAQARAAVPLFSAAAIAAATVEAGSAAAFARALPPSKESSVNDAPNEDNSGEGNS